MKLINYLREVGLELAKVDWPKREEVVRLTLLVFVTSAIISLYLGALDFGFTKLLGILITR